jgi:predicted DNA-binding WGR domain protein
MRVHGVSMHYYNQRSNNDKFYRAMYWQVGGAWYVGFSWGRDSAAGQTKVVSARDAAHAAQLVDRKKVEQLRKGYQWLGDGYVDVADQLPHNIAASGQLLHNKVGRPPLKLPTGMDFVIVEEDDVEDILKGLVHA